MSEKRVKFGKNGLDGVLHSAPDHEACIVTCHGLFGSKDSPKYIELAEELCRLGFSVFRFDFRKGENIVATLTQRIEDSREAIDFLKDLGYEKIGMMGSSLGGCVAILTSVQEDSVESVVTWATPSKFKGILQAEGLEELKRDVQRYDVIDSVRELDRPILIVHGSEDELVPVTHAYELFENARAPKELLIVGGADHRFTDEWKRRKAVDKTVEWFGKYVKS